MPLQIFNTLTNQLEPFAPAEGSTVRMYSCGPTVYNFVHIGNLRTFTFQDILRRYLRHRGYALMHVMNVTDVEDKIIRDAGAAGLSLKDFTAKYTEAFFDDCAALRLEKPERITKATEHIDDMIALIKRLEENGYTYKSDGSIYFRIASFAGYGKLSKLKADGIKPGARVDQDEYEKDDARDFALWKAAKSGEPYWDSPFGPGRPGWHIECSAMSMRYLGETFDIHTGGEDLVFPHHENEIAQSEGATGKPFVRFWLHSKHLLVDGQKMSKSAGNFYTLRDLLAKGYAPEAIRYVLAKVPHGKQLNFTFDEVHGAQTAIERLRNFRLRLRTDKLAGGVDPEITALSVKARQEFEAGMDDDLNTSIASAAAFDFVREINSRMDAGRVLAGNVADAEDVLNLFDSIFQVLEPSQRAALSPEEVEALIAERLAARKARDFARSDQIRDELKERGVILEDTRDGTRWKYSGS
jgi:cysteinyl-tRNA synthetase